MKNKRMWRGFFQFSAIFNFSAAFAMLIIPGVFFDLLMMGDTLTKEVMPWLHQFAGLVLVFGFGYWLVSTNPMMHKDIVWMGCVGKTVVFSLAWIDIALFDAPIGFGILVVADLIFAMFFAVVWRSKEA
ncbi:Uncharacterised protein [Zhongshania aliphaticivorans]|uniref:Uncharacterized protein n=1 Tax=Zhongshania aliphaticivorans TaxID=1470434 RepID=A0A5S9QAA2_9GAMM|nr:hypothetical protein [Zhongshania aliphaticivorans]CAA0114603.1 Uncharacterised protein [Zhongshania aliphaticivorans]CAA0122958.1 Uncharacterised protein [Zhongshania aliphaticivorans]